MRFKSVTLLIMLLAASVLIITPTAQDIDESNQIITVIHELNSALVNGDIEYLDTIFADDAMITFGDQNNVQGSTRNRAGVLEFFEELMTNYGMDIYPVALSKNGDRVLTEMRLWMEPLTNLNVGAVRTTQFLTIEDGKISRVLWFTDALPTQAITDTFTDLTITKALITGDWLCDACYTSFNYRDDGTFTMYDVVAGKRGDITGEGTYTLEGDLLTTNNTMDNCEVTVKLRPGLGWAHEMQRVSASEDGCGPPDDSWWLWQPYYEMDQ